LLQFVLVRVRFVRVCVCSLVGLVVRRFCLPVRLAFVALPQTWPRKSSTLSVLFVCLFGWFVCLVCLPTLFSRLLKQPHCFIARRFDPRLWTAKPERDKSQSPNI
jgi:hypothetical protein